MSYQSQIVFISIRIVIRIQKAEPKGIIMQNHFYRLIRMFRFSSLDAVGRSGVVEWSKQLLAPCRFEDHFGFIYSPPQYSV